ncbi:hypothetical protein [Pseudalkalibacillus hwajinpoensis]|uniref:hypothetical protein n=1 Tax=Guptibacillus hwajinpoensis TaxID=208199 RepID=UPI001CD6D69C|nr:hypothetical protein [Pseudalkalibacillus hwajinpoensis]MCA0992431.1 hypothetical protein [Pseudalkalibacillus hwajinpoensis]
MKQRLFLSVLCILFLMYDAVPRFQIDLTLEGAFFSLWLLFAVMALGGNLAGLFFGRRETQFITEEDLPVDLRKKQYSR